jgi:hypothetical protein
MATIELDENLSLLYALLRPIQQSRDPVVLFARALTGVCG